MLAVLSCLLVGSVHVSNAFVTTQNGASTVSVPSLALLPSSSKRRNDSRLFMGWGPDPVWSNAEIVDCVAACENSWSVKMKVPDEVSEGYTVPGQYLQLKQKEEDEKALFLAVASPPNAEDGILEFLIKETEHNQWISDASKVCSSQVMGGGFAIQENVDGFKYDFPTQNVILCATGSGIAPIRSVIESDILEIQKSGRTARLYYGCKTLQEMAYTDRFEQWEKLGVQTVPILSQPEKNSEGWNGRTGYVQTALEEDGIPIPRNSAGILCGVKGMTQAVTDLLTKSGVFEGRILQNF